MTMIEKIEALMSEIKEELSPFTKLYIEHLEGKYDKKILKEKMRDIIRSVSLDKQEEYNEMWKMLSDTNCWYVIYQAGQILHSVIMSEWSQAKVV